MEFQKQICEIYNHLCDDESKRIFANRLMYSLTNDKTYIYKIVKSTMLYKEVEQLLNKDTGKKYIVSAGYWGKNIIDLFGNYKFDGILDNNKKGSYKDISIFSLEELMDKYDSGTFYIASTNYNYEFIKMLIDSGISESNIVDIAGKMLECYHTRQYFDLPELTKSEYEIFVDCGCFDGENSIMFTKWASGVSNKIYAFEPDSQNIRKCKEYFADNNIQNYKLIQKGIWSEEKNLKFEANSNEGSKLSGEGNIIVPVTSIDQDINERVTFIKMDIEGAECEGLLGARQHISNEKPKLAISVYHKMDDIWNIPSLILEMNSNYKFYLRHYSLSSEETVLYAI